MASAQEPEFIRIQRAFGEYLRDPDPSEPPPAGVEERRMKVYRRLVRNNISRGVRRGFPVLREAIGETAFSSLVDAFMAEHASAEPVYRSLAGEFLGFLSDHPELLPEWAPWAVELADYEWQELVVNRRDGRLPDGVDPSGDLIEGRPVLNPTAEVREYRWPVHRISKSYRPTSPPETPTVLVVFRPRTGGMAFHRVSPLLGTLLRLFDEDEGATSRDLLAEVARATGHELSTLIDNARPAMEELRERGIILGAAAS